MTDNMDELEKYTATCHVDGCEWEAHITPLFDDDVDERVQRRQEEHYSREHMGTARITVTLEREVSVHPDQSLLSIVDDVHDSVVDRNIVGFEVAYTGGEMTEEPNGGGND